VYELTVEGRFAAAHNLRDFKGKCENLHGHNWKVEVIVQGSELIQADLLMDFGDLKTLMNQALDKIDHQYLNELEPFITCNPSSELIAKFIYDDIAGQLPKNVSMVRVSVWESPGQQGELF
jgi:6-pyruvoyltetrahydropterin/6-carboxytetrahydropterin synthase